MHYSCTETEWDSLWIKQAESGKLSSIPVLAPEDVQVRLHGTSGVAAMQGALKFRKVIKGTTGDFASRAKFLDFGCGWGRHIRVFLKDFEPENIYGVDIDPANIHLVKELVPDVNAVLVEEGLNIGLSSNSIDLNQS